MVQQRFVPCSAQAFDQLGAWRRQPLVSAVPMSPATSGLLAHPWPDLGAGGTRGALRRRSQRIPLATEISAIREADRPLCPSPFG